MANKELYDQYHEEIYFFLLKRVNNESIAKDILQNTFLKAYENFHQLKQKSKTRAWLFRIARNEMINYYNRESDYVLRLPNSGKMVSENKSDFCCSEEFCCFDNFINELPEIYKEVIELVYKTGKKQWEAAEILKVSLPTVKARIKRAKSILTKRFKECCHYEVDEKGKLHGEPDCIRCNALP